MNKIPKPQHKRVEIVKQTFKTLVNRPQKLPATMWWYIIS